MTLLSFLVVDVVAQPLRFLSVVSPLSLTSLELMRPHPRTRRVLYKGFHEIN